MNPGSLWRHYKGGLYLLIACCRLESTKEPHVVYKLKDEKGIYGEYWCRPLAEWNQEVSPGMNRFALEEAAAQQDRLTEAIRKHRDQRGDDRCWMDDEQLYATLPEGYTPPVRDTTVELEQCRKFIASRQNPKTEYVSPQREIERLQAEVNRLQKELWARS